MRSHPDHWETLVVAQPTLSYMNVVTLIEEYDEWRAHAIGPMLPPAELGKNAYSW
jgi:hypothetical protein